MPLFVPLQLGSDALPLALSGQTLSSNFLKSSVKLDTINGYGSTTNNRVRRWTNSVTVGSDMTYADDSVNGMTLTINTTGWYYIRYQDQYNAGAWLGLSKNAAGADLTTIYTSLGAAKQVADAFTVSANLPAPAIFFDKLSANDVIRTHTNGTAAGTSTFAARFIAVRLA